jgi:glycosyltransferase involved in cell wall biosynthesis
MRAKLEDEAAALGITESVVFLGDRPDPENVYAGVDIVALTSLNEGTPLSIIEAMASERPVVSTLVGGVADLLGETRERIAADVELRERGVAVTANDPESFATALMYLAKDEKVRLNVSAAGRAFVVSNYSKERLVSNIKSLYRNLIR